MVLLNTSLMLTCILTILQELKATLSLLLKPGEKTYTQRCRLFIGNLPNDISDEEFKKLFAKYGEPSEVFINKNKGFGFIRLVRTLTCSLQSWFLKNGAKCLLCRVKS